ncbi:hypothetical protein WI75_08415 [Burkholderia ubonensis]|nr:hypothetical protein WI75_08415 [Burkholderia ubonensis]
MAGDALEREGGNVGATEKAGEYHLFFWGGIENDGLATAKFGPERNYWFATPEARTRFRADVSLFAHSTGHTVCFNENDGPMALKRTVAKLILVRNDRHYAIEYDFGYGYPAKGAEFMFYEGNYACDCNLSRFIRATYPDIEFPELGCGDEIDVVDFEIEYRD